MPTKSKKPGRDEALKKENSSLRKQVRELRAERDQCLRALHSWAKEKISTAELRQWMKEDEDGGSLLELLANLKKCSN